MSTRESIIDRTRRERDEARAEVEKLKDESQTYVDTVCWYRNLAIRLGAKPDDMRGKWDRDLCAKGLGAASVADLDYWRAEEAETWRALEKAEARLLQVAEAVRDEAAKVAEHHPRCRQPVEGTSTAQFGCGRCADGDRIRALDISKLVKGD